MILSLQTSTFGWHGGIPVYNKLICRVINDVEEFASSRVLIAMDQSRHVEQALNSYPQLQMEGFDGNRLRFVSRALGTAFKEKIDLILAGHINYAPLALSLKMLQPRARLGVFVYGMEVWTNLTLMRRQALQRADFLISISDYTREQVAKFNNIEKERIYLLPNALEEIVENISAESVKVSLPSGTRLLSVGRLDAAEQQKGFDTVIKALPDIIAQVPDAQYIIIGDGSDLERHKRLAAEMGVAERVHFLGFVDDDVLRSCYQSCDVFVMPSAQEGFGFVYIEAMQYNKPVVAANSGGAPEVVKDGVNGILVEYGNVKELAEKLAQLCLSAELREQLGRAGYEILLERFTFPQFKNRLKDILKRNSPNMTSSVRGKRPMTKVEGAVED